MIKYKLLTNITKTTIKQMDYNIYGMHIKNISKLRKYLIDYDKVNQKSVYMIPTNNQFDTNYYKIYPRNNKPKNSNKCFLL